MGQTSDDIYDLCSHIELLHVNKLLSQKGCGGDPKQLPFQHLAHPNQQWLTCCSLIGFIVTLTHYCQSQPGQSESYHTKANSAKTIWPKRILPKPPC